MLLHKSVVSATLKRLREERHLTREELTARAMISVSYINNVECGDAWPSLKALFRIAEGLEMKPSDIVREIESTL